MKGRRVAVTVGALALLAFGTLIFLGGPARAVADENPTPGEKVGAELMLPNHQDVSAPLREIKPIPPDWWELTGKNKHPVLPLPHHHGDADLDLVKDAARQPALGPQLNVSATPGLSFDGVGVPSYTPSGAPPDTVGAAGATQYVQWVNTAFAVYNKTTGALVYGPANGNTLWSGFGDRCATDNSGDPIVMYDKAANRWVMMQFAVSAQPFLQCIAVSQTSDATGAWNRYSYSFGSSFNDYPKGGVWPDGYYVTYNMFNASGTAFLGAKVCAMDRARMLSGQTATQQCFDTSTAYGGLLPADRDGATPPPAGAPNYVLAFDDAGLNGLNLWKFHVDWTTPANSTFTGPTKITTTSFTEACNGGTCIPQSGTTQRLDSLADRLMFRLAYRNFGSHESLVVNHSVTSGGVAGIRWYEIRNPGGTPSVLQQSTFQPDTTYRWMGSIAQDQQGNMMVGYSASSSSLKPGIRVTGRLASDPLNTMQAETTIITGAGAQTVNLSRWGDYSSMTIDPSDDCTFWYTTQYLQTNGTFNWSTRIASFKFPGCGGTPTPDYAVSASPSSLSLTQGTSGTSTITVGSLNGFNSAVALTASGLPSGVTATFAPSSVTPPANGSATSTLTLTASATATTGTSTVTVTGTSGSTTRSTSISLTVTGAGALTATYDATLKAPKCGSVGISCDTGASLVLGRAALGPEPNQPNTINNSCADGTSGAFHSDESNDRLKVATTDGSNFAPGKTVTISATVWAWTTPSSDRLDLYYAANANSPTWTFLTTLTPAAGGAQTLTANYTLPTGALQAVRAQFRYTGSAGTCTSGGYNDRDDLIFAVGGGAPDTTPPTTSITAPANGATVGGTVNVTASASDNVGVTRVEFYIDGGLSSTDTTSPYSFSWNTTGLVNGSSHTIQSKAYDAANNVGTSSTVTVTVNNTGPVTVFYDGAESPSTTLTFTNTTSTTLWTRNATAPFAGSWRWKAGSSSGGNYGNNGDARMTTPTLNLSGATTATLTYAFKHNTEVNYDFFQVRISTDGGTTWTNLVNVSGNSSGWDAWAPLASINLNAYLGQTNVKIQFRLTSDGSVTAFGAAVDEIKVVKQ
jgi:Big-like domain-containing protein/immune inhibitor InhA-like protein